MRILLDTNIFIYREQDKVVSGDLATLLWILNELRIELLVHPLSIRELRRDPDEKRRDVNLSKVQTYSVLQRPPDPVHDAAYGQKVGPAKSHHDVVDDALLYSVYKNSVDFFITEDRGIHKKAPGIGVDDRVFLISEAVDHFTRYLPSKSVVQTPPALTREFVYNLNLDDPIFDTLKSDYPGFDRWFDKISRQGRECYINKRSDGSLGALLIYKIEDEPIPSHPPLPQKRRLKIATMKVTHVGYKIGELLIKVSIDIALRNGIYEIYLTHFTEPEDRLVELISEYGFFRVGVLKKGGKDEDVFLKQLCVPKAKDTIPSPVEISQWYYPSLYDGGEVRKYIVPIQPEFHDRLFTDFSDRQARLPEYDGDFVIEGNTIKKAYLSHSRIRKMRPGDIVLLYRSGDKQAVTSIGVIDAIHTNVATNDEIFRIIGKRSVYSKDEIERSIKPLTVILFRHHFHLNHYIPLTELKDSGILLGPPQSITEIGDEKYGLMKRMGDVNESFTVH